MTIEHTREWYATLTDEERIKLIHEHWQMKQILCAQTLLVPTGTANWLARAVRRAEHLTNCRQHLQRVLRDMSATVQDVTMREFREIPECHNCMGSGVTSDKEECVCCRGSGKRVLNF